MPDLTECIYQALERVRGESVSGPIVEQIEKYYEEKLDKRPKRTKRTNLGVVVLKDTLTREEGRLLMDNANQALN